MHSLVAKMSYPKEIGNTPIPEIKSKFHDLRQKSKSIEFAIVLLNNFVALYGNIENKELGELQGNIGKSATKQEV